MAVQKILSQQIANTGGTAGQVLVANSTGVTWGDANNATNLGGVAAASYQTTAGLSSNVAALTANNATNLGGVAAANYAKANLNNLSATSINQSLIPNANNTFDLGSPGLRWNKLYIAANTIELGAASISSNGSAVLLPAGSQIGGTNIAVTTDIGSSTANNANNLGGVAAASYVNTAGAYTRTGVTTFNANAVIGPTGELVFDANSGIYANGSLGTSGQVLTSNATTVYWSTVSGGGGGFTNGQSISVANLAVTGSVTANGSVGTSGQALVSTGTGVQWGALSPGYNYSSQFGGGNQYLGITTSNAAFGFGTGEFTIEAWFYPTLNPANGVGTIFEFRATNNASALTIRINTSLQLVFYDGPANVETAFTTRTVSLNTWQHVAFVRIGNTVYGYINGLLAGSVAVTSNLGSSQPFYIGSNQTAGYNYYGLASNVRVVKGTGVYTGAFTPPTSPLSAISGTSVLTCNSITPTSDSSTNAFQFTNGNGVTTTATLSPFTSTTVSIPTSSLTAVNQQFVGDGSTTTFSVAGGYTPNAIAVYYNGLKLRNGSDVTVTNGSTVVFAIAPQIGAILDVVASVPTTYSSITPVSYSVGALNGSSQYLTVGAISDFKFLHDNTTDWTVEAWVNPSSIALGDITLISTAITSANIGASISLNGYVGGDIYVYLGRGSVGNATAYATGAVLTANIWQHIAVTFTSSTKSFAIYVNGVSRSLTSKSTETSSAFAYSSSNPSYVLAVGRYQAATPAGYFSGYISNLRIAKTNVYTNNFTVPSSPLAITQSASGAFIQAITGTQTALLTCNGPTIIDGSTNAFTITNNGTATVSTSIVPTFTNVTINNILNPIVSGSLSVTGNTTLSGTLTVTGNTTLSGTLTVTGNTAVSGTFTRPNNPAFMAGIAVLSNATYTANPYAFVFNTTAYNVGSNYNTSNGRFTAPVAGVYLFGFSIYVGSNPYAQFCFRKNGSDLNFTSGDAYAVCEYPASISDHGFTHSAALSLAAGDYVTVGVRSGSSGTFYQGHTYFWGHLVG